MTATSPLSLKACPFCGDSMMWLEDVVGFTHEQTNIDGATCKIASSIIDGDRLEWWNTRASIEDEVRELREALERVKRGLLARDEKSRVIHPVPNHRLIEIIDAALSGKPAQPSGEGA